MTTSEIAKRLGISRGTVSRVLNNHPNVKEETRQRVLDALAEYNYCPNEVARSLVMKQSFKIDVYKRQCHNILKLLPCSIIRRICGTCHEFFFPFFRSRLQVSLNLANQLIFFFCRPEERLHRSGRICRTPCFVCLYTLLIQKCKVCRYICNTKVRFQMCIRDRSKSVRSFREIRNITPTTNIGISQ